MLIKKYEFLYSSYEQGIKGPNSKLCLFKIVFFVLKQLIQKKTITLFANNLGKYMKILLKLDFNIHLIGRFKF